jgi:hypothetical protein
MILKQCNMVYGRGSFHIDTAPANAVAVACAPVQYPLAIQKLKPCDHFSDVTPTSRRDR